MNKEITPTQHKAVLIKEVVEAFSFDTAPKTLYFLDVTCGGGTHTRALLDAYPTAKVIALDWDINAIERLQPLVEQYQDRLTLVWGSFSHLYKLAKKHKFPLFHGILADFGTSQDQIHTADGFSFLQDTPLDMRMSSSHFKTTAAHIVNYAAQRELSEILWTYGEEQRAKDIVRELLEARKKKKIKTTFDLVAVIEKAIGWDKSKRTHPATKTFQALRIFVNKELDNISAFLPMAFQLLANNGKLVCISFHSLEDRLVKDFYKTMEKQGEAKSVFQHPVTPSEQELIDNQSSRSSKLRVLEKIKAVSV